jgi:hypothetical protein
VHGTLREGLSHERVGVIDSGSVSVKLASHSCIINIFKKKASLLQIN